MPRSQDVTALKRARAARKHPSVAEDIVWQFLRASKTGFKFRREHQVTDKYRLDFFCREAMLAVEMDGEQHNVERDQERDDVIAELGILTLRIPNRSFFALDEEPYRDHIREIVALCERRTGRVAFPGPDPHP
jgi:very-short-patch-repair endonuclease